MIRYSPRRGFAALVLLPLAACSVRDENGDTEARVSICEPMVFEDVRFTHCTAEPGEHAIATELSPDDSDTPYRSFDALAEDMSEVELSHLALAMNGGMFNPDGFPIGYYVEDGLRFTVLNQNEGPGNFHLLPNGVFFGETAAGPWRVWETERFADSIDQRPEFATQSGPMLVISGDLHPAFDNDGPSRTNRNAVGVDAAGRAHFVLSDDPVSMGKLARLYRDVLGVNNALYLDGTVSLLWDPASGRMDRGEPIGPIILVTDRNTDQ